MQTTTNHLPANSAKNNEKADYHFITTWRVKATREEVYRILEDVDALAEWWPSVYLDVKMREKGQPGGDGLALRPHAGSAGVVAPSPR